MGVLNLLSQSHPAEDRFEICLLLLTDEFMGVLNLPALLTARNQPGFRPVVVPALFPGGKNHTPGV